MLEGQARRVQCLTLEGAKRFDQFRRCALRQKQSPAVHTITDERIVNVRHVYSNLVSAACFELEADMRMTAVAMENPIVSDGFPTIFANRLS